MQKLSVEVLEKMLGADLSNHEIDMMLYIARFQDEFGHIRGVYYTSESLPYKRYFGEQYEVRQPS